MTSLGELVKIAPSIGWTAHKTSLMKRLASAGCAYTNAKVAKGQKGKIYYTETLPPEFRATIASVASNTQVSLDRDFGTYLNTSDRSREKADKSVRRMEKVKADVDAGATIAAAVAKVAALPEGGASPKTLHREWRKVKDLPWDQWHAALVPGYKGRKAAPMVEAMWLFFKTAYARDNKPTAEQCYRETRAAAKKNSWGAVPSVKTFIRTWNKLDAYTRSAHRDGKRTADKTLTPRREINRDDLKAMFLVSVDTRTIDLLVRMPEPDGRVIRLSIAAAIDEGSGYGLHYVIGETESSTLYRKLLVGVARIHGLPAGWLFDNTMAAANKDITGGVDLRYRFTRKHDELDGVLKRCNMEVHFTTPGSPQSKLVERAFNDFKDDLEKAFDVPAGAYTGRDPTAKPESYGTDPIPYAKALEVIERAWQARNAKLRPGSRITKGRSYAETHAAKLKGVAVRRLTAEQERLFLAKAYAVTPSPDGKVRIGRRPNELVYWSAALRDYARGSERKGRKIAFLVDPEDFSKPGMAYSLDGTLIEANVERWGTTGFRNHEDQANHTRRERQVKKSDRNKVKAERLLTEAEMRAFAAPSEPAPEHPKAEVVGMVPGRTPKLANTGAARPAAPASEPIDFAEIAKLVEIADMLSGPIPLGGGGRRRVA